MIRLLSVTFLNPPIGMPASLKGADIFYDSSIQCVLVGDALIPIHNVRGMVRFPLVKEEKANYTWTDDSLAVSVEAKLAAPKSKRK